MKKIRLTFFFLILLFTFPLSARALHVLMLGDTACNIGQHVQEDLNNVRDSFQYLAAASNMPLYIKELNTTDGTLYVTNIAAWIQDEKVALDDVVVLYYSGHGSRQKKTPTIWPRGEFPEGATDFSQVMEPLFNMNASLYVVLLDCCNITVKSTPFDLKQRFDLKHLNKDRVAEGVNKLFFKARGVIIASAASVNEYGWCYTTGTGSYFTTIFLKNFFYELQSSTPAWKGIFKSTREQCFTKVKDDIGATQTPQYKLFLKAYRESPKKYKKYLFKECRPK